jgi:hypothetical protein
MDERGASQVVAAAGRLADAARQRWRSGLGLAAVAVLACAVVVVVGRDGGQRGVRVVETGFSVLSDELYGISFGVVIENTTDDVAYHTVACVEPQLESGDEMHDGCWRFTVEVLLPGQRVGFGAPETLSPRWGDVTGISVELDGPATWEDPDQHPSREIVAGGLEVAYSRENHPVVSFDRSYRPPADTVRNATAYALLRDDDGDIVGATSSDLEGPVRAGETVRHSVVHEAEVPDLATAEVYVFPSGTYPLADQLPRQNVGARRLTARREQPLRGPRALPRGRRFRASR